jgi:hypothetical protein
MHMRVGYTRATTDCQQDAQAARSWHVPPLTYHYCRL